MRTGRKAVLGVSRVVAERSNNKVAIERSSTPYLWMDGDGQGVPAPWARVTSHIRQTRGKAARMVPTVDRSEDDKGRGEIREKLMGLWVKMGSINGEDGPSGFPSTRPEPHP